MAFHDTVRLSDGTFLIAGGADHLDWLPEDVDRRELLGTDGMNSSGSGRTGFVLHLSSSLQEILDVLHLPEGQAEDVRRIRLTSAPGEPTVQLTISGGRHVSGWEDDGYFIARLDGNYVDGAPTRAAWIYDVDAEPRRASGREGVSAYKQIQPWDVTPDGGVVFGRGAEYEFDWASVHMLDNDGQLSVVENWPAHWTADGECHHTPASDCSSPATHSFIVLKAGRKGSLRSHIHISWLGRLTLDAGTLEASTYVAEYSSTTGGPGEPLADTNLDGWPNPNGGWPDVNTTRCADLTVLDDGRVAVACTGRRTITTDNAHQQMLHFDEGVSKWNEFLRVYSADLSTVSMSTLVTGTWDPVAGPERVNTVLSGVAAISGGVVAVGWHELDEETGAAKDSAVLTTAVPPWGSAVPTGQAGLLVHHPVD